MENEFEITTEVRTGHLITDFGYTGSPSVTFDAAEVLYRIDDGAISEMIVENDLKGGYATDVLARHARGDSEAVGQVETLFQFIESARELGVDTGGYDVQIKDREAFIQYLAGNRSEVLTDELVEEMSADLREFYNSSC